MKKLAQFLAEQLVDHPDRVEVDSSEDGGVTRLAMRVADEDKGKIIGKQGKVIKAIRAVVGIAAAKANRKTLVDLD